MEIDKYEFKSKKEIIYKDFVGLEDIDLLDVKPICKRDLVIFFLIQTSGNLKGHKIKAINSAMEKIILDLKGLKNSRVNIKIAVLEISTDCEWKTKEAIDIEDYNWTNLFADGLNDLGAGFIELSNKLSKEEFLKSKFLNYPPLIFLITDGYSTDDAHEALEILKQNIYYKYGLKVVIGINERLNRGLLRKFTTTRYSEEDLVDYPKLLIPVADADIEDLMEKIVLESVNVAIKENIIPDYSINEEYDYYEVKGIKESYLSLVLSKFIKEKTCEVEEDIDDDIIPCDLKEEIIHLEDLDYNSLEIKPITEKELVVFFLIDTSSSMAGKKIGVLNTTMEELIPELRDIRSAKTNLKLAVMTFSSAVKWITEQPIAIDEVEYWRTLEAEGDRNIGAAFIELSKKLSIKEFLRSEIGLYAPVIFLFTDGCSTDDAYAGLEILKKNNWYKYGLKIGLGIGDKFDKKLLEEFTGNPELVVTAKTSEQLAKLVKTIVLPKDIDYTKLD